MLKRINQVRGRALVAWFGEEDRRTFKISPNAEIVYFERDDEDAPDGALQISGDEVILDLIGDELKELSFGEHQGTLYPESVLEMPLELDGFRWNPDRRPMVEQFFAQRAICCLDASQGRLMSRDESLTLRTEGLTKRYKRRVVVNDVTIEVQCGEIVGLLGPNGAGKSTSFHMIVGMERPEEGRIYLGDEDVTALPMYKRARRGIGYLAQESSVFRHLTVEQNLHAVLEFQKVCRAERTERVDLLLEQFGLNSVRGSKGYMLSGGERRRTEIARALALRPRFFLLDEPFAGVDPITVEYIQENRDRAQATKHRRTDYRSQRSRNTCHHRSRVSAV